MTDYEVRMKAKAAEMGVRLYEVVLKLGICENTFNRWRHKGMTEEQFERTMDAIDAVARDHAMAALKFL